MLVKHIELKNFKTIGDFKGDFAGGIYLITGENEVGKSTLLSAIATLLTGDRSNNLLKQGEEKGHAKMTVGDYEVEIKFTDKNPRGTITVTTAEGMKSNNISTLQNVFQYQDFDAHEFVGWSESAEGRRKQVAAIKSLLPDEVVMRSEQLDIIVAETKEAARATRKDLKDDEAIIKHYVFNDGELKEYAEPVVLRELFEEKEKATKHNDQIEQVKERLATREQEHEGVDDHVADVNNSYNREVEALRLKLKQLEEDNEAFNKDMQAKKKDLASKNDEARTWLAKNEPIDVSEVTDKIENAEEHNTKNKEVVTYGNLKKRINKNRDEYEEQQQKIKDALDEKAKLLGDAKLPVDGLTFSEEGLFLNGVPFAPGEVSTSQEMEVAAKLIIAKNPKVKVFRIAQGESLGKDRLESIVKFATDNGYQGFIEEVRRGQSDLVIENYTVSE